MRKLLTARRRDQAAYQRDYRRQQKQKRQPSRDDVARVALHLMITRALRRKKDNHLHRFCALILNELVDQGFEKNAASLRIDDLVSRYERGWDFQRKPHLSAETES